MSSIEEAETLKNRAYVSLHNAKRLFEEEEYDLAAFNIRRFCQLILKYKLLVKAGTYPRTHSLLRLMRELSKLSSSKNLENFIDSEIMFLTRIENACIVARYFPRRYERREVEELLRFAERFREVIENI